MTTEKCVIGPCECGGYGVIYNEEWKAKLGRCHDAIGNLPREDESNLHPVFEQAMAPFTAHMDDVPNDQK